ncbi:MAG TPA: ATP-binding cassette domain-containing protein [Pirellulales bacterium]|jgi:molybdate transport system ATP-binding protein|nr:ATP-binding cassette domain-containing protein [Pirellulales bacterium]
MSWLEFNCRHRFASGFELDVVFQAAPQVVALFGPSGSGKTSVLSIIAGGLKPQRGFISLRQRKLLDTASGLDLAPQRRNVGLVFQDHLLFPHLSVEANLRYGLVRQRAKQGRIEFARIVEVLELGDLLTRLPRSLSGGERQRVALGRSLLSCPEILLLDEPLTALDQPLKERILVYLERVLAEWRVPTLFVSHGSAEVRRLAEWVIVLDGGRVASSGRPEELLCHELESAGPTAQP